MNEKDTDDIDSFILYLLNYVISIQYILVVSLFVRICVRTSLMIQPSPEQWLSRDICSHLYNSNVETYVPMTYVYNTNYTWLDLRLNICI